MDSSVAYLVLFHEAAVANLLEVRARTTTRAARAAQDGGGGMRARGGHAYDACPPRAPAARRRPARRRAPPRAQVVLYHRHACEALDEDALLELADWALRKLAYLNSAGHRDAAPKGARAPDGRS